MGHYLSEMESDDDHFRRTVLNPMAEVLRTYDKECQRGIMHTPEWNVQMRKDRKRLLDYGIKVGPVVSEK